MVRLKGSAPYKLINQWGASRGGLKAKGGRGRNAADRPGPRRRRWHGLLLEGAFFVAMAFGLSGYAQAPALPPQPQGYAEVSHSVAFIVAAAEAKGVPPISVAAGIMNQGNAVTRPFGTDLIERAQLAAPFESPVTRVNSSVGIAQLTPSEMKAYVPGCSSECLFQSSLALRAMAAKLGAADDCLPRAINPTDRLMVLALAQNSGPAAATAYLERGGHWSLIYQDHLTGHTGGLGDNDQLRKILVNVRFLQDHGFRLPEGVDLDRWQQIVDTQGGLERYRLALRAAPSPAQVEPPPPTHSEPTITT